MSTLGYVSLQTKVTKPQNKEAIGYKILIVLCEIENIDVSVRLSVLLLFITTADAYIYKYLHYRTRWALSNIVTHGPDVTSCGGFALLPFQRGTTLRTLRPYGRRGTFRCVSNYSRRSGVECDLPIRFLLQSVRRFTLLNISLVDLCALPMRQRHLRVYDSDRIMKDFVTIVHCARRSHMTLENISPCH